MAQNRKFQNFVENKYMADNAVGTSEIVADSVTNAKLSPAQAKSLVFLYDFSTQAGAQGAITMTDTAGGAQQIPDNAVITKAVIEVETAVTSGGSATVAIVITGNTDAFIGATAGAVANYSTGAVLDMTYRSSNGNDLPIKTSAARNVLATIGTADLTAGKLRVYVEFYEGA